jgi:class 3 adenylate cyclase
MITVRCTACNQVNREGVRFCEECGTALARRCGACGADLSPTAKFCGACGGSLAAPPGSLAAPPAARASNDAVARKVVTIVFADLVGSTALHERLDAESARRLMDRYYQALHTVVAAHGGTVVKLLGDGVMAAFGVPRVAENDAIRAVRAAVAMQHAFHALAREQVAVLGEVGLRIAVNTGEVVVSGEHDDVVGDPVNVAARLQQEAREGDVLLGEATRRLVSDLVTLEPFGTLALKGGSPRRWHQPRLTDTLSFPWSPPSASRGRSSSSGTARSYSTWNSRFCTACERKRSSRPSSGTPSVFRRTSCSSSLGRSSSL